MKPISTERPDFAAIVKERLINLDGPGRREFPDLTPLSEAVGNIVLRQLYEVRGKPYLRMSSLGQCLRKLSYIAHEEPINGRELDARSIATFACGDAIEAILSVALEEGLEEGMSGWGVTALQHQHTGQSRVELFGVSGHPDGLLLCSSGDAILSIKSTNSFAFRKWEKAVSEGVEGWEDDESYWWSEQAYMHAMDVKQAYILVQCKDSGAIMGWWMERDEAALQLLRFRVEEARRCLPGEVTRSLPGGGGSLGPREDRHKTRGTPNKHHGELPWQCCYCAYYRTCWPGVQEDVGRDWRGGPKKVLRVVSHGE